VFSGSLNHAEAENATAQEAPVSGTTSPTCTCARSNPPAPGFRFRLGQWALGFVRMEGKPCECVQQTQG
jgi:hypothetical protein